MTLVTKPILLNETGEKIADAILEVKNAIRGYDEVKKPWSISINNAQSSPILADMGGDKTSWMIYRQKIGRYLMTADGKAYKLDKKNSLLFEDGTEVDDTQGDVMVHIPRLYYKVTTNGDITTLQMCEREFSEDCEELNEQWIGAYIGYVSDGKLCSRHNVNPTRSKTISQFHTLAQAKGTDWGLSDYHARQAMMIIYLCEFLDLNSQACLGNGMTGTGNNWCAVVQNAKTGATAELGDDCGKMLFNEAEQLVGGAYHVSLFGIEDPYGWFWEMIQGVYFGNSENEAQEGTEAYIYEGNRMPTTDELATTPSGVYRQLVRPTSSGWLKNFILGTKFDILPSLLGGSSTTYGCDYHYTNNTGQLLLWGGFASDGSSCGLADSYSNSAFLGSSSGSASRLAYYGEAEIVSHNQENTVAE